MTHPEPAFSTAPSATALPSHPFDRALALVSTADGQFEGQASPDYWNLVGPFGGMTAAIMLNAILRSPGRAGEPVALTVNYAAPLAQARFGLSCRLVRASRTTQHWLVEIAQGQQTVATATAVLATRRATWAHQEITRPEGLPSPESIAPVGRGLSLPWFAQYELRPIRGLGSTADPQVHSHAWIRDAAPRSLDFPALACLCDTVRPWIFVRRNRHVAVSTVSLSVYFHASAPALDAVGTDHVYTRSYGQICQAGFMDNSAQVWSRAGVLLATTQQMMWVKE